MWKPSDLRLDFIKMKSGALDSFTVKEIKDTIQYHEKEVANVRKEMSVELFKECEDMLWHIHSYLDFRKEKEKEDAKEAKKAKKPEKGGSQRLTPTELYKVHFGENPSQVFRQQVDAYDKTAYARWLREQTRHLREQGNN